MLFSRLNLEEIVEIIRCLIFSEDYKNNARRNLNDFTRNRKMTFSQLMLFMTNQVKTSIQTALDHYFEQIGTPEVSMTEQAYSLVRQKLKWEACRQLMDTVSNAVYRKGYETWHSYRIWAIDGSKMQLPSDPNLLDIFGTIGAGSTAVTAQSSCLYDVLNDIIMDAYIEPMAVGERILAQRHINFLAGVESFSKELITFDRGYPSFEILELLETKNIFYLMRLKSKFNIDIDEMPVGKHTYTLLRDGEYVTINIVKFPLPGGEIETLITNLDHDNISIDAFKELYFRRWGIETKYAELKLKLEIENFSGRTELAIRQEYYIAAYLSNLIAVSSNQAQESIDIANSEKENTNKYDYKVNKNHAIGVFKDRFIKLLLEVNPIKKVVLYSLFIRLLSKHLTPIRPNRSAPRNQNPRNAKFHFNKKSNC